MRSLWSKLKTPISQDKFMIFWVSLSVSGFLGSFLTKFFWENAPIMSNWCRPQEANKIKRTKMKLWLTISKDWELLRRFRLYILNRGLFSNISRCKTERKSLDCTREVWSNGLSQFTSWENTMEIKSLSTSNGWTFSWYGSDYLLQWLSSSNAAIWCSLRTLVSHHSTPHSLWSWLSGHLFSLYVGKGIKRVWESSGTIFINQNTKFKPSEKIS